MILLIVISVIVFFVLLTKWNNYQDRKAMDKYLAERADQVAEIHKILGRSYKNENI